MSAGNYVSPNTDCAYTYVIIMTDGEPSYDEGANNAIESLTGEACGDYDNYEGESKKNCLPELAEYMATNDLDGDTTNGSQFGINLHYRFCY